MTGTITSSGYNSTVQYVRYPSGSSGTVYYTAGDTISVTSGSSVYFYCNAGPTNTIFLDGTSVGTTSYTWIPDSDFEVEFTASIASWGVCRITRTGTPTTGTTITYGGNTIATLSAGQTFTSSGLANKLTSTNIVITANGETGEKTTVTYNGNTLFEQQSGKYTIPANNIIPYEFAVAYVPAPSYPVKGDTISLNVDGTNRNYKVLRINGSVAEVFLLYNLFTSAFGSSNIYEGSTLDVRLNETYYNSLTSTAKTAIVDKTFRQDQWHQAQGSPLYYGVYATSNKYQIGCVSTTFGNAITRHCYALSVADIIDCLGVTTSMSYTNTTLNKANVQAIMGSATQYSWLRSASLYYTVSVYGYNGSLANYSRTLTNKGPIRPAFQIDLSKISWSKV